MSKNRYLLEVGTEELPAGFLETAPQELADKIRGMLTDRGVAFADLKVLATPRRLAIFIDGLAEMQPDQENLLKGPPVRIGLDADGKPTKAAEGFAKKAGINAADFKRETIEGEEYLVVHQKIQGRPVKDVLAETLPDLILGLSGSHFMRWADLEIKFSRPVRWLLSLWNKEHLPVAIGPVQSGTVTYGHRVLSDGEIPVASVDAYADTLAEKGKVLLDQHVRKEKIWKQLQEAAQKAGGHVSENEGLLDTVTMLVEYPSVVVGGFDSSFLEIPDEVTTTVMQAHQKYFPLEEKSKDGQKGGGKLLPNFMTVSNGPQDAKAVDMIRAGNERVLKARFEDAKFFFKDDQTILLEDRLEKLQGVTFQKGLGSMKDKTVRLVALSAVVGKALGQNAEGLKKTERAATLAKADLVTGMVFEFTELQGVMGKKYALLSGEDAEVAEGIFEHYLPRFTGDVLAQTPTGLAVGLADKLDTMMAVFSQKDAKLPTGSKDPLGLRRMATGINQTVLQHSLRIDLITLLEAAYDGLGKLPTLEKEKAIALISEFTLQRLKVSLLEQNIRHDIIDAVLDDAGGVRTPLRNLTEIPERISVLKTLVQDEAKLKAVYEPANRVAKILSAQYNPAAKTSDVSDKHFKDDSEKALLAAIESVKADDYGKLVAELVAIAPAVNAFFDKVLVNDPDEAVKKNRYAMLSCLHSRYLRLASFVRLVV